MTNVQVGLPLTAAQQDIWFDDKITGGGSAYNTAIYWEISGPLDLQLFETALTRLVDEAECTRIRFVDVDDRPRQVIEPLSELPLTVVDVSAEPDPFQAARDRMRDDLRRPFALTDFPLFRLSVYRLGADRTVFCFLNHHLVSDGFSYVIYFRRLAEIYQALLTGAALEDGRFPALTDLIEAEARYAGSAAEQRDRAYWAETVAGAPDPVSLATRDALSSPDFHRAEADLPADLDARLRAVAWDARMPWSAVIAAALGAYTQRMTGARDLLLSLPVTARSGAGMQAVPGMVVNYVPVRLRVGPGTTRGELLAQSRAGFGAALRHQRFRVSGIRRQMGLARGPACASVSSGRRKYGGTNARFPSVARSSGPC
jgi:hypothetical protein